MLLQTQDIVHLVMIKELNCLVKKEMLIIRQKKKTATEIFNSNQSHSQKPFLNFLLKDTKKLIICNLNELISLHKNKIKSRSTFKDGYIALKLLMRHINLLD